MRDNELFALLIAIIEAGEPGAGIPDVDGGPGIPVYQAFQPTQQGVPSGPAAFLYIVDYRRVGSPQRSDVYDEEDQVERHTETQVYETTFQVSALSTQDPATPTQYTAGDIINLISYILQSSSTIKALRDAGVGIEKPGNTRNPYFQDDRERFEASPSFDFVITHKQIVTSEVPVLQSTEFRIRQV